MPAFKLFSYLHSCVVLLLLPSFHLGHCIQNSLSTSQARVPCLRLPALKCFPIKFQHKASEDSGSSGKHQLAQHLHLELKFAQEKVGMGQEAL